VIRSLFLRHKLYPKVHAALCATVARIGKEEALIWELCCLATPNAVRATATSTMATQTCDLIAEEVRCETQLQLKVGDIVPASGDLPDHSDEDLEVKLDPLVDPSPNIEIYEDSNQDTEDSEPILEAPAEIDEYEAGRIQDQQWATAVEAQIAKDIGTYEGDDGQPRVQSACSCADKPAGIPVVILAFNKHPDLLAEMLEKSQWGQKFVTKGTQVTPDWARGAKIFVEGLTQDVLEQTGTLASELRPWHVIILEQDQAQVHASLEQLPYRSRPRVKSKTSRIAALNGSEVGVSSPAGSEGFEESSVINLSDIAMVKRTFISMPVPLILSPRSQYTRSSTDRHELGVGNPRIWKSNAA